MLPETLFPILGADFRIEHRVGGHDAVLPPIAAGDEPRIITTTTITTITITATRTGARPSTATHSHVPEGEITMGSLIALGASGGLVPCPSALVLLLSAISLGRAGLGMLLLVGFSAGLAVVLMGMGVLVLCVGNLLPASGKFTGSRAFRLLPVASAALITCVGLVMTGGVAGDFSVVTVRRS